MLCDLAPDVLQIPPIELLDGKELSTRPTFSNLFQSSPFFPSLTAAWRSWPTLSSAASIISHTHRFAVYSDRRRFTVS
ncbi:hypothetical protein A0H81_00072 [Grifola frondosa]|uniref:Uncharacterized protein n=1 Tax=Grifola frondosa TaxID=5627 RepID=A0A1C7MRV0_GRIFR|nr:hypothetical protein A0H81_00072 [Grifola frondosa]